MSHLNVTETLELLKETKKESIHLLRQMCLHH